jgi:hypothetical protein
MFFWLAAQNHFHGKIFFSMQEWCEKQMEFMLIRGRPEKTAAMKVGSARHTELETEVSSKTSSCFKLLLCL